MTARLALAADLGYQLQLAALASGHAARQELAELHLTPARVTALIHPVAIRPNLANACWSIAPPA